MQYPNQKKQLTHLNDRGEVSMVDVSPKQVTLRTAIAQGHIKMKPTTLTAIEEGNTPKGDVISTAKIAGIMAAKQTANLIPLCHPLALQKIGVEIHRDRDLPGLIITATVKTKGETGVEMEALTAVSVAALTLYDMAKALEQTMEIGAIHLVEKNGGKQDFKRNEN